MQLYSARGHAPLSAQPLEESDANDLNDRVFSWWLNGLTPIHSPIGKSKHAIFHSQPRPTLILNTWCDSV